MTTSPITFEHTFRQRLLDVVYAQWAALGAPFSERAALESHEVIDPESLLWCSLEFAATEPRLAETVLDWLGANGDYLVRQRVCRKSNCDDPRAIIWDALEGRPGRAVEGEPPFEPCYGLHSAVEVLEFARWIGERRSKKSLPHRLGRARPGTGTLLLRARDLIGQDIRHFLLVYLLANLHGGRLREIQAWSGYSYRSLSAAAARWEAVGVVILDHGYCHLTAPGLWRTLLQIRSQRIVLVNWSDVFETSIHLLRDLAKARHKGIGEQTPVSRALRRDAAARLALTSSAGKADSSVGYILDIFSRD